jgi:NAD(P)-dependent dehydrogenase (short-subunit alcohol dehydrogenase family)
LGFLYELSAVAPVLSPVSNPSTHSRLDGCTALVTGASGGIGEATAAGLAALGARVLMFCRPSARAGQALQRVAAVSSGPSPELLEGDLSRPKEVLDLAGQIRSRHPALHLLVNNAGIMGSAQKRLSPDGWELTMTTNHLGPYALTMGLMPALKAAGGGARIVNVSSGVHLLKQARFSPDDLHLEGEYSALTAYARSKLMNVLFTRELSRRLDPQVVTANSLHPGVVATGIDRGTPGWFRALYRIGRLGMLSPVKGAQTTLYLAASPAVRGKSGGYYVRCRPAPSVQWPDELWLSRALWDRSAALMGQESDWC